MMLMLALMQLQNRFNSSLMYFAIIIQVRLQENVLLYLFRNIFDNSWVNVYWDWSDVAW